MFVPLGVSADECRLMNTIKLHPGEPFSGGGKDTGGRWQLWRHLHMRGGHAVGSPACALVPLRKLAATINSFLFAILHVLFKECYEPWAKARDC